LVSPLSGRTTALAADPLAEQFRLKSRPIRARGATASGRIGSGRWKDLDGGKISPTLLALGIREC
jgi:hypothetical protein